MLSWGCNFNLVVPVIGIDLKNLGITPGSFLHPNHWFPTEKKTVITLVSPCKVVPPVDSVQLVNITPISLWFLLVLYL